MSLSLTWHYETKVLVCEGPEYGLSVVTNVLCVSKF